MPYTKPSEDLKEILINEEQIQNRLGELSREIEAIYQPEEITVISIINGALIFTADLIRRIPLPLRLDCIRATSYGNSVTPVHTPKIIDSVRLDVAGRHILLIDDILDTGNTLMRVRAELARRNPASIRTCVLLDKKARRQVEFEADLVGFTIPDEFVVGYGLDFAERYRHLPYIGILRNEIQNPTE